ncbi:MAG: LysM peptidoglycan-binding domain-containing protein [Bacteroidetes bacterium]|nr:LysM peptidoglycan-binding domain-containing protein [Bacteroidota bacterium]MBT3749098.1 LysM peptidoglycan-binding domain-containing protein [Bacteroidota bacterium]MBT4410386.1 LysM peptidoglycan-binding domain-containing protein [Bacteroidota bacterium]MBT7464224.1 LysM peptidoglycan-binding domain-containing protein [Bacteroidota bacterium]
MNHPFKTKFSIAKLVFRLVLLCMISGVLNPLSAQYIKSEVNRSTNIIMLDGKRYYLHEVKSGHTLYSIAKKYNVSEKLIGQENPVVRLGQIKNGQIIKIPLIEVTQPLEEMEKDLDKYIYHIVAPKQTLSAISRLYKIPVHDIITLNPGIESILPMGKELKLPRTQIQAVRESFEPVDTLGYIFHKVKALETLFSLSRLYGMSVKEIKEANPELRWGLNTGEVIRIPSASGTSLFAAELSDTLVIKPDISNNEIFSRDHLTDDGCGGSVRPHDEIRFKVAFLLPLFVNTNDTLHLNDTIIYPENDVYARTIPFLEYLEGSLLAIDSLRKSGLSMDIRIYDTERSPSVVRDLVTSGKLNDVDLIFGPVYPETIEIASIFSRLKHIPLVSPLSSRGIGIEDNPYLFQVNPTEGLQHELASIYLSRFYDKNILLVKDTNDYNRVTNRYSRRIFNYLTYKVNPKDIRYRDILFTDKDRSISLEDSLAFRLEDVLSLGRENLVIIPSTNKVFVADVINRLNNLTLHYDITVFGNPQWGRFDALQLESLYKLNLHYYTNFSNPYVNYGDSLTLDVCKRHRLNWNNEPTRFSFQGFDVTYYFIRALYLFGRDMVDNVDCWPIILNHPTLQTNFHFTRKSPAYGFENQALSIVRYNPETLVKEKINSTIKN